MLVIAVEDTGGEGAQGGGSTDAQFCRKASISSCFGAPSISASTINFGQSHMTSGKSRHVEAPSNFMAGMQLRDRTYRVVLPITTLAFFLKALRLLAGH